MSGSPQNALLSRLGRWAVVLGCCITSAALVGATRSRPAKAHPAIRSDKKIVKVDAAPAEAELLHDVPVPSRAQDAALASASLAGYSPKVHTKTYWMLVTAYCGCKKCCGPHACGLTASGRSIAFNDGQFVAADARLFKFGTKLRIPGYAHDRVVQVIDRGGAIKGYHLDVFFPSHQEALNWGRQWIQVTVVE